MAEADELAELRILISDDEALARARIRDLLGDAGLGGNIVGEAANGAEVIARCRELEPDLVLLDIRMPGMSGLQAASELKDLPDPPAIIFTTAYDEHALEAFERQAVDYLLKPIRRERLEEALYKAVRPNRAQRSRVSGEPEPAGAARSHLSISSRGSLQAVPIADVRFFRAEHKYVTVGHVGGEALLEESLKSLEDEFSEGFVRIHRNALVAKAHLTAVEKDQDGRCFARLAGIDERLEVSRRHAPALRQLLRAGRLS